MTGAGAVMNTAAVRPGQSVVVWGAGGVGLCALAGASILGAAPVVAVDIDDDKLRLAKQFGATAVVNARTVDPVEAIREMTRNADGTRGADVVLDCTGLGRNIPTSLAAVRPGIRGSGVRGGSAIPRSGGDALVRYANARDDAGHSHALCPRLGRHACHRPCAAVRKKRHAVSTAGRGDRSRISQRRVTVYDRSIAALAFTDLPILLSGEVLAIKVSAPSFAEFNALALVFGLEL